nr:unnamed protein product [Callosobruchus chinensis]
MNARLAKLWTSYANVVKYSLACCVRLCSWPCNSYVKCGSPKGSFSADVILP